MSEFKTGTVQANGLRFATLEAGDGPLVLCLHGFPDHARSFRHQLPALAAAGFRAVAPFLRGYAPAEGNKPIEDRHVEGGNVPVGSVAKGEALATTGGATIVAGKIVPGKTAACGTCHGADLKGLGPVPGLAGRSPSYQVRQLYDMKAGTRKGLWSDLMKAVVASA
jgi:cytochrome c553